MAYNRRREIAHPHSLSSFVFTKGVDMKIDLITILLIAILVFVLLIFFGVTVG